MKRFKQSFELNHPDLVRGRNVVVIDASQFVNDPGQKKDLRDHKGSHWQTCTDIAAASNFPEINDPLRELKFDQRNLIIDVCKVGRHRSEACKAFQILAVAKALCKNDSTNIDELSLQSLTNWNRLCNKHCPDCSIDPFDITNSDNATEHYDAWLEAWKVLSNILPTDPNQITSEVETSEPEISTAEERTRQWIREYCDQTTRKVLKALNGVYGVAEKIPKRAEKIRDCVVTIVLQQELHESTVRGLF